METHSKNYIISKKLQKWYASNKRDLPWRGTDNPYIIWISEIILQQTRVNQGYDYFQRFVQKFPDVTSLAHASEEEVLKLWQGLGYYSRARNLHTAAMFICTNYQGTFPDTYKDVIALKGVGEYTAAAIMSFAYKKRFAVVDGNVNRVVSRLFAVAHPVNSTCGKHMISQLAHEIIDPLHPAEHNQAIMDLGSVICTPTQPKCTICPLQDHCKAFYEKEVARYPLKLKSQKKRDRYFHYFHIRHKNETYLFKRVENDVWKNLYEFPLIETPGTASFEELRDTVSFKNLFGQIGNITFSKPLRLKHILSHQRIHTVFYDVTIHDKEAIDLPEKFIKIPVRDLDRFPVSRLIHKYLERI